MKYKYKFTYVDKDGTETNTPSNMKSFSYPSFIMSQIKYQKRMRIPGMKLTIFITIIQWLSSILLKPFPRNVKRWSSRNIYTFHIYLMRLFGYMPKKGTYYTLDTDAVKSAEQDPTIEVYKIAYDTDSDQF